MLISRKILQSYFNEPLPTAEELARGLTLHSYEVEGIEERGNDEILDIDVLPNRASDSLSHIGVAREVGLIFDLEPNFSSEKIELEEINENDIELQVKSGLSDRFIAVAISGLENKETPSWLKEALENLGERSINPIVDITNYVMLATGQPLHAYDLDFLESFAGGVGLGVDKSQPNTKLVLLDQTEVELSGEELIIRSMDGRPLGLAGVKGGLDSSVTEKTSRILLEAANFDQKLVRQTARRTKTQTDASKRFENGIPADLAAVGVSLALKLIKEIFPEYKIKALKDYYPTPASNESILLEKDHTKRLLGVDIPSEEVERILRRVGCLVDLENNKFLVTPPWYRPDLQIAVDLVEEVARLYGLDKIPSKPLTPKAVTPERSTVEKEILRDMLVDSGYSEIITRAFRKKGDVQLANPLAKDLPFLRKDLSGGIQSSLDLNSNNAELLELEYIRVFEIGTVFTTEKEKTNLAIGIQKTKNARSKVNLEEELDKLTKSFSEKLGIDFDDFISDRQGSNLSLIVEYDLDRILENIELMPSWDFVETEYKHYSEFSQYPYTLRDLAVWTPEGIEAEDVEKIIRDSASDLLQVVTLFDRFSKDFSGVVRTSYAFRLVFQSFEKTLSDAEANEEMKHIYSALSEEKGFEVR